MLFTDILKNRLLKWSDKHVIITEAQFEFKPGYGTTDAISALRTVIIKW